MGTVLQFRSKPLTGFIPELPEPFASNYAKTRSELASLVSDRAYAALDYENTCSEINPDCA